jgi:hypothetical protein
MAERSTKSSKANRHHAQAVGPPIASRDLSGNNQAERKNARYERQA